MRKIGFIGLGHMGKPMVNHLLDAGFIVQVFDVMPVAIEACVAMGAVAAENPGAAAKDAEVVFTMLQTGEQVASVCHGDDGVFAHINNDALYIDSSSIDINTSRALHTECSQRNLAMLDAPVSGGVAGAIAATLTIMVGGEVNDFKRGKVYLEKFGKRIIHTGPAGNGQAAKICNNMLLGISMIAVSETFVLAEQLGLSPEKLFEVTSNASGQCWSLTSYCPVPGLVPTSPANKNYEPGFTAQMMLKDLQLSQDAARSANVATPLGAEAAELYTLFNNSGNAQLDFSAIIKMLRGIR
ncbi:MAG: 3-hydroxyisobutyrate dehydrogenase [Pseudomonadota bacterium]|nr:3-hydroxyisobutyrate dehydrogenase [Pseudomonadota bacterium]